MAVQHDLAAADSGEAEITAAEAWRDSLESKDEVEFSVRRRDTHEPVPIDQISLEELADLEVVFTPAPGEEGEAAVWRPMSREALEMLFVE